MVLALQGVCGKYACVFKGHRMNCRCTEMSSREFACLLAARWVDAGCAGLASGQAGQLSGQNLHICILQQIKQT